jgi:hypothetical protein
MLIIALLALIVFIAALVLPMVLGPVVSAGAELDGLTTLVWGTAGALQSPVPGASYAGEGYYVVESIDEAEDAEQEYGTNGTGIKSWRMTLKHGRKWNITVTDDINMTPPTVNGTVQVLDYLGGTPGSGGGGVGNKTVVYTAKILSNDYRTARKQAGQRVLQVENLTLIDTQP